LLDALTRYCVDEAHGILVVLAQVDEDVVFDVGRSITEDDLDRTIASEMLHNVRKEARRPERDSFWSVVAVELRTVVLEVTRSVHSTTAFKPRFETNKRLDIEPVVIKVPAAQRVKVIRNHDNDRVRMDLIDKLHEGALTSYSSGINYIIKDIE
jgi:hypothetical protein